MDLSLFPLNHKLKKNWARPLFATVTDKRTAYTATTSAFKNELDHKVVAFSRCKVISLIE
jgi:hypothetical protein